MQFNVILDHFQILVLNLRAKFVKRIKSEFYSNNSIFVRKFYEMNKYIGEQIEYWQQHYQGKIDWPTKQNPLPVFTGWVRNNCSISHTFQKPFFSSRLIVIACLYLFLSSFLSLSSNSPNQWKIWSELRKTRIEIRENHIIIT